MANAGTTRDTMRVLYVHTATLAPLGADTWIHARILQHIDRSTNELYVACRTTVDGAPTPTYEAIRHIPHLDIVPVDLGTEMSGASGMAKVKELLGTVPAVLSIVRLLVLVWRRRIAIVHTSDRPRDVFVAVVLARLSWARSVVHVHVGYNPGWMGWMLRWSLGHADALMAISSFVGDTLVEGGLDRRRVHVVLNGIEVDDWTPGAGREAIRDELAIPADAAVVTTVCRLFPEKGPGDLITAVSRLRAAGRDVVLLVVGVPLDPAYGDELRRMAVDLGVDDLVHFLGRRLDVESTMAAADLYAMPSHDEPFGLVFVEAMAMELAVVAVADGGTLEVVEHGTTGLLSTWHDIDELSDHLARLLDDATMRTAMGLAGRRRAEERFTAVRLAADVAAAYRLIASTSLRTDPPSED